MVRVTHVPFRDWPWRSRLAEKLYRLTHGGQTRTLVVREDIWITRDSISGER